MIDAIGTGDERQRALERAHDAGDEEAARGLLAIGVRHGVHAALAARLTPILLDGKAVLGPLLEHEIERVLSVCPDALGRDRLGIGWVAAEDPAVFGAVLHVRLRELDRVGATAPRGFTTWFALKLALDVGGETALERLGRVVSRGPAWAAERAGLLLAERQDPVAGVVLAEVALGAPAEARAVAYRSLAQGSVPLERARPVLKKALAREGPELRRVAAAALLRDAPDEELSRLRQEAPPEVKALAFEAILERRRRRQENVARAGERKLRARDLPVELVRAALVDGAPEVRRSAVQVLAGAEWERDARAHGWLMGRLLDPDRAVRTAAMRLLRSRDLPARAAERLRTIALKAPPSLRPPIERLAERVER